MKGLPWVVLKFNDKYVTRETHEGDLPERRGEGDVETEIKAD